QSYPLERGVLLMSISAYFRAPNHAAVATLGHTAELTTLSPDLRQAAAHALAAIHNSQSMPYLAALLDDPDFALRVEAIGGMSAFANSLATQNPAENASLSYLQLSGNGPYRTPETIANFAMGAEAVSKKESSYLAFWKAWWQEHRAGIVATSN
ncbi:MAG: HEAT repeat domain-containing protein, partial [Acidobacteriota bacterium]|nr:HEAT repeat domain-containing protein [Acidobacteriota bacterium]